MSTPSLIPDLLSMFPDDIIIEHWLTSDQWGGADTYGTAITAKGRVSQKILNVRGADGEEQVSTSHVALAGVYDVAVRDRITLPVVYARDKVVTGADLLVARQPEIICVTSANDSNGRHHEKVYFK